MRTSKSSQSIPTTPFVRHRLSEPEIQIEVGGPPPAFIAPMMIRTLVELPPPPPRLARRSAAVTVPPREPRYSQRRVIIILAAVAIASGAGGALLHTGARTKRAAAPMPPAQVEQVQAPPAQPPAPPVPEKAPAAAPPACAPQAAPSTITLRVTSRPSDATVLLDGVRIGRAPLHVVLPRATRDAMLKLRRTGYRSESVPVTLDRDADLHIAMQPKDPAP